MRIINPSLRMLGSEQMSLVQLFIPREVAHDTIAELGDLGNVQFKDVRIGKLLRYKYCCKIADAKTLLCSLILK
jgi:vacuolar-type H+-ATPase subunit I/STV1